MKLLTNFLITLGVYTTFMFVMGYLYASYPLVRQLTCTPDLIDRIFK